MISRKLKQSLILWGFFIMAGGAVGIAYSQVMGGHAIYGFTIGCSLTAGVMGFELFWVQGKYGSRLRALPLLVFILVSTLVWAIIIAACLQYIPSLVLWDDDPYGPGNVVSTFKQDMLFSLGFSFVFNTILRVRSLIGGRVFINRLLRQYFPRGTNLTVHSQAKLNAVARQLNERPRKTLGYDTPAERFNACVASTV